MQKKPIFSLLAALSEVLNKIPSQDENLTALTVNNQFHSTKQLALHNTATSPELNRIADALERIALVLEKLTLMKPPPQPKQSLMMKSIG